MFVRPITIQPRRNGGYQPVDAVGRPLVKGSDDTKGSCGERSKGLYEVDYRILRCLMRQGSAFHEGSADDPGCAGYGSECFAGGRWGRGQWRSDDF